MGRCSRCRKTYYCSRECQAQHYAEHKSSCKRAPKRKPGEPRRPGEALLVSYQLAPSLPFEDLDAIDGLALQPWRVRRVSREQAARAGAAQGGASGGEPAAASGAGTSGATPSDSAAESELASVLGFPLLAKLQGSSGRARMHAKDCLELLLAMRAVLNLLMCDEWLMRPQEAVSGQPETKSIVLGGEQEAARLAAACDVPVDAGGTGTASTTRRGEGSGSKSASSSSSSGGAAGSASSATASARWSRWASPSDWTPRSPRHLARAWPAWLQTRVSVCADFMLTRGEREEVRRAVREALDARTGGTIEDRAKKISDQHERDVRDAGFLGVEQTVGGSQGTSDDATAGSWHAAWWRGLVACMGRCCCCCPCSSRRGTTSRRMGARDDSSDADPLLVGDKKTK